MIEPEKEKDTKQSTPAPEAKVAAVKPEVKPFDQKAYQAKVWNENILNINMLLSNTPNCLEVIRVKRTVANEDSEVIVSGYRWMDQTKSGVSARQEIREGIKEIWDSGAYNYEQIAKALRIGPLSVRAMLDQEFIEQMGLE